MALEVTEVTPVRLAIPQGGRQDGLLKAVVVIALGAPYLFTTAVFANSIDWTKPVRLVKTLQIGMTLNISSRSWALGPFMPYGPFRAPRGWRILFRR
jgi:hypothetical protein